MGCGDIFFLQQRCWVLRKPDVMEHELGVLRTLRSLPKGENAIANGNDEDSEPAPRQQRSSTADLLLA